MTEATQAALEKAQEDVGNLCGKLSGADYYEFLSELKAHLQCLADCYQEEHPEDFE